MNTERIKLLRDLLGEYISVYLEADEHKEVTVQALLDDLDDQLKEAA